LAVGRLVLEFALDRVDFTPNPTEESLMSLPQHSAANPFALLMDPQAVFRAIENSERLERLHSRVCRPLDKPLLPIVATVEAQSEDLAESAIDELDLPGEEI
jgi:hypothetical protein